MKNNMTGEMVIVEMKEEHLDKVAQIEKETFSTPWTRQGFLDAIYQDCCCYLVVLADNQVVAYCGLYQSMDEADITNVAVSRDYRNQGIARVMLTELMDMGRRRGIVNFTLEVRVSNVAAQRLYTGLGFESVGIRKDFYRNPVEDANIMWFYGDKNN